MISMLNDLILTCFFVFGFPFLIQVHPDLTEEERKQLCRSIDVHKLSLDSCMHVSQNDRLPLRMVIRVLFSEHMKLRNARGSFSSHSVRRQYTSSPCFNSVRESKHIRQRSSIIERWVVYSQSSSPSSQRGCPSITSGSPTDED